MKIVFVIILAFITGIVLQNLNKIRESNKNKYKLPASIAAIFIILLFLIAFSYIIK